MTTLYNAVVKRTKKYFITHHVAGDLSHNYEVRETGMESPGFFIGTGLYARNLSEANQVGRLIEKYGYDRAYEMNQKKVMSESYRFGYLPDGKLARQLAPDAYGEYAEKLRKKYRLKQR